LQPGNASGFERVTAPLVQGGLPNSFVQATGDIYCNGSLKFNDSVVLAGDPMENIIKVHTGARGCTLYVGRSAFISGKIQLAGTDRGGYLAIAAKHGIYAGYSIRRLIHRYFTPRNPRVGFWNYAFSERFNSSIRPPEPPLWPARRIDPSAWGMELLEDGIAIYMHELGAPAVLKDACSNPVVLESPWAPPNPAPDLPTDAAIVNPCGTRAVADIEHVVLVAPSINWGFDGNFKGVMIAETAVGPAGRISFEFDDRFLERKGFQLFPDLERAMGGPLLDHEE
jgi:hypothetical protein